jgi:hypothetical protein
VLLFFVLGCAALHARARPVSDFRANQSARGVIVRVWRVVMMIIMII